MSLPETLCRVKLAGALILTLGPSGLAGAMHTDAVYMSSVTIGDPSQSLGVTCPTSHAPLAADECQNGEAFQVAGLAY